MKSARVSGVVSGIAASAMRPKRMPAMPRSRSAKGSTTRTPLVLASSGSWPCMAANMRAAIVTFCASGPTESSVCESGATRDRPMRPMDVFSPTQPHRAAGMRTEPPVSVPSAPGTRWPPTATPEPDDEPPGMRCVLRSHGFLGVPTVMLVP